MIRGIATDSTETARASEIAREAAGSEVGLKLLDRPDEQL
jgi:hypothetical protein